MEKIPAFGMDEGQIRTDPEQIGREKEELNRLLSLSIELLEKSAQYAANTRHWNSLRQILVALDALPFPRPMPLMPPCPEPRGRW